MQGRPGGATEGVCSFQRGVRERCLPEHRPDTRRRPGSSARTASSTGMCGTPTGVGLAGYTSAAASFGVDLATATPISSGPSAIWIAHVGTDGSIDWLRSLEGPAVVRGVRAVERGDARTLLAAESQGTLRVGEEAETELLERRSSEAVPGCGRLRYGNLYDEILIVDITVDRKLYCTVVIAARTTADVCVDVSAGAVPVGV